MRPGWRCCERRKMKLLAAAALLGLGGSLLLLLFPAAHAEERKKGPKVTAKVSHEGREAAWGTPSHPAGLGTLPQGGTPPLTPLRVAPPHTHPL